jgi:hypothetical protein
MFDNNPNPEKWEVYEELWLEMNDPDLAKEICMV